jgi:hypothetical protein
VQISSELENHSPGCFLHQMSRTEADNGLKLAQRITAGVPGRPHETQEPRVIQRVPLAMETSVYDFALNERGNLLRTAAGNRAAWSDAAEYSSPQLMPVLQSSSLSEGF